MIFTSNLAMMMHNENDCDSRDEEANLFWKKSNFLSIAKAALHALTPFVTREFRIQIYLHL